MQPRRLVPRTYVDAIAGGSIERERHVFYGSAEGSESVIEEALEHDYHMRMHLLHVNRLALRWSGRLGLDAATAERFVKAALLHDLGKVWIPRALLLKPSSLNDEESAIMREHVGLGADKLAAHEPLSDLAPIVRQHHEWFDGSGYPNGLKGEQIDRLARAISIIDAFSAMTVDRPYHIGIPIVEALIELERFAGRQFDPELVKSFVALQRARSATFR